MIRSSARKVMILAAAALCTGTLAVNCSKGGSPTKTDVGSVGLALTLPGGGIVSTVRYSLRNSSNAEVRQGDINVQDAMATVSVVVGGVPAGTGYTVILSATANDGTTCSGTSAAFSVTANMSTSVSVLLLCRAGGQAGTVVINGQIDSCPVVTSYIVSPIAVSAGGTIDVSAAGADLDASDTVTYAWTATAGTFDAPGSASTRYHCPAASSQQVLTITVSDNIIPGSTPPRAKCSTTATVTVNCGLCGNNAVDTSAGETCDPPNGTTCDATCHTIAVVCGNNIVQPGEQCDPPNGTTCSTSCQNIPVVCGNSIVQPGEQCDPPNGTTCSATCQTISSTGGAPGTGGAGTGGAGTGGAGTGGAGTGGAGTGGAGTGGAGTGGAGTGGMSGGVTAACAACETQICAPQGVGCSTLTGSARTACEAAVSCMRTTHCAIDGDTSYCYCGTASQDDGSCSAAPLGLCITQLEAADPNILPTDTVTQRFNKVAADLVDPSLPIGKATGLIGCDAFSCNTPATCQGQF